MQANSSNLLALLTLSITVQQDIFAKYAQGVDIAHLPFRLFRSQSKVKRLNKKGGARGPYRRYTSSEKLEIIQRMLSGQSLKKIAEKSMIPKRNLIRWKHEYLFDQKHKSEAPHSEDQSVEFECASTDLKKDILETRQIIATQSMDLIRLH